VAAVACGGFVVDALVAVLSFVRRKGGGKVGLRRGHVALGLLHELTQVEVGAALAAPHRHPGHPGTTGGPSVAGPWAAACVLGVPLVAEACGRVMEEDLAGAPELLLFDLIRSLQRTTTTAAAAAAAARSKRAVLLFPKERTAAPAAPAPIPCFVVVVVIVCVAIVANCQASVEAGVVVSGGARGRAQLQGSHEPLV
jgi:hypothetical protein